MRLIGLVLAAASLSASQSELGSKGPGTLPEITKRLNSNMKVTSQELVTAGIKLIQKSAKSQLSDELAFLTSIADRDTEAQRRKNLVSAVKVLEIKYKDENLSLLRVLIREADLYRDGFSDRLKEREILERAEKIQQEVLVQQSLDQLALFNRLGESYLGVADGTMKSQTKSREYFSKVLEFEFPGRPAHPSYAAYQALYINAACRLVETATNKEIKTLRFHPFAFATLYKRFPKTAKLLNKENPWVAAFNARVERWLESTAKDLPKDSPLRPHFEGVLQYVRKDKPD